MNFDRLREQILERAIQGKLVPQLESEPGVAQITGRPKEPPFAIPEKWKWAQLKNVGKIVGGGTPKTNIAEYWENGQILWFTPSDLGKVRGLYAETSARKITLSGLQSSAATMMPKGTVLFSSRAPIGHIALAPAECCTNQGCKSFVANSSYILPLWAYWVLVNRKDDIISRASGTTFKEISLKGMSETWIPLPSIQEQQRIIDKIQRLFRFVDLAEVNFRDLQLLSRILHRRTLQLAIQGKLVPQLESEPEVSQVEKMPEDALFNIPSKWKWMSLGNVLIQISDGSHNPPPNSGQGIPVLSAKNINNGIIDTQAITRWTTQEQWLVEDKKIHIESGDVLLTIIGSIGRTAVVPDNAPKFMLQRSVCIMRTKVFLCSEFLALILTSPALLEWMTNRASGTAQKGIYLKKLKTMPLPIPPLPEQLRIVKKLKEIFSIMPLQHFVD